MINSLRKMWIINTVKLWFQRNHKYRKCQKPNYFVAASIAAATDEKAAYIKNKAFDKQHYKTLIIEFLKKYHKASRVEIDELLMDKLSNVLSEKQKRTKKDRER